MKLLNLKQLFTENVCSFEMAKLVEEANGSLYKDTYFVYDDKGTITTNDVWLLESYACISLAFAISLLDDKDLVKIDDINKLEITQFAGPHEEDIYIFKYDGEIIAREENLVDLILRAWLKFMR